MTQRPFALIILDGLGNNPSHESNAFYHAQTPTLDKLLASAPGTEIITCGTRVGLPAGQMGNSEVGHLNIGAGRVVEQELTRINRIIAEGALGSLPEFTRLCTAVKRKEGAALHLLGLVSLGGVHSYLEHLKGLILAALRQSVRHIVIHVVTDGRDRPPQSAVEEVRILVDFIATLGNANPGATIQIGTIIGRYFAMDRDSRWERTQKAYDVITRGVGESFTDPIAILEAKRAAGLNDEFLEPMVLAPERQQHKVTIEDGDALLMFNFRADRLRQLVRALTEDNFTGFERKRRPAFSHLTTLTEYDASFTAGILFEPQTISMSLGEVIAARKLRQLRLAETEKYPHVTYFFNGGREQQFAGEHRILIPSPRDVATYDLKPEMSAIEVTDALVKEIADLAFDVAVVNYANCDMVGHTGVFSAAVKAVETVDTCLARVLEALRRVGGTAIITADHGNAEQMIDYDTGEPHTAHTTFPVPFFLFGEDLSGVQLRRDGALCDIAPTICELLQIDQPPEMSGASLIARK